MKAAAYTHTGGPDVLEYVDVPDPTVRRGGLLIEVGAVGIQGGDLLHRAGGVLVVNGRVLDQSPARGAKIGPGDRVVLLVGQLSGGGGSGGSGGSGGGSSSPSSGPGGGN